MIIADRLNQRQKSKSLGNILLKAVSLCTQGKKPTTHIVSAFQHNRGYSKTILMHPFENFPICSSFFIEGSRTYFWWVEDTKNELYKLILVNFHKF